MEKFNEKYENFKKDVFRDPLIMSSKKVQEKYGLWGDKDYARLKMTPQFIVGIVFCVLLLILTLIILAFF